jgi:hypothetical protein
LHADGLGHQDAVPRTGIGPGRKRGVGRITTYEFIPTMPGVPAYF